MKLLLCNCIGADYQRKGVRAEMHINKLSFEQICQHKGSVSPVLLEIQLKNEPDSLTITYIITDIKNKKKSNPHNVIAGKHGDSDFIVCLSSVETPVMNLIGRILK